MAFTATLENVAKSSDPGVIDLQVTYADSDHPDWGPFTKLVQVTIDPALGPIEQRQAIRAQIIADARIYRTQLIVYVGLKSMEGESIEITAP